MIIWFKPTLPESDRADLKALFDKEKGYQLLLVPRRNMPYAVAERLERRPGAAGNGPRARLREAGRQHLGRPPGLHPGAPRQRAGADPLDRNGRRGRVFGQK